MQRLNYYIKQELEEEKKNRFEYFETKARENIIFLLLRAEARLPTFKKAQMFDVYI